ncbi:MAG: PKD domain-containing protein [bacterium]
MEEKKFSFRQFIYLSGGLFLIVIFLLVLKLFFPNTVVNTALEDIPTRQASLNWDLLRKPISVIDPTLSATLSALPQTTTSGSYVDLTAKVEGISQGPFTYHFDCRGDGVFELETGTSFQKNYTAQDLCFFDKEGVFLAKVVVDGFFVFFRDGQEIKEKRTAEAQTEITVQTTNVAPFFSKCDVDSTEGTTQVNFKFNFTAEAQDPNGDEIKYEWDFGDGNKAEGQNVEYTYKTVGYFVPKAKVTDSRGGFSYCVADSLTVLKGLSSFEVEKKPEIIGRQDPFSPVKPGELLKKQATTTKTVATQATTTQATTTKR